jgi:hypothetical protein
MQINRNSILSIIILLFFLPATVGFALFRHSCDECHAFDKEASFVFFSHNEDSHDCFCPKNDAYHGEESPDEHDHNCLMDLKKLEQPFTLSCFKDAVPSPIILDCCINSTFSFLTAFCSIKEYYPDISTDLFALSGQDRLISNSVFRL